MVSKDNELYIYYLIGKNLKKYRKLSNYTQESFSRACNYSAQFIANLESAKTHQTVSLGTLWTFSKILKIPVSKLLEEDSEE